jgi:putative membrane protein
MHVWGEGYGWPVGLFIMLLFWGGLILVAILLIRTFAPPRQGAPPPVPPTPPQPPGPDPKAVLRERFARGEITEEEYRSRLRVLDETST